MPTTNPPLPKSKVQRSATADNAGSLTAATKKKRDGGRQPKRHAPKDRVSTMLRRAKILRAAIQGKSLKQAALETGLSPKTAARQAGQILRDPVTQTALAMIMDAEGLTDKFLVNKVKSLLNARQVVYFQHEGTVTDHRIVAALETQRKTLELAMKLKGHLREQPEVNVEVGLMAIVVQAMRSPGGELYEGDPQDVVETRREVLTQGGMRASDGPANS